MSKPSAQHIRRFYGLLRAAGLDHQKENMLAGYDAQSVKDLTLAQLLELCEALAKEADKKKEAKASPEVRRWRSVCLDLLTTMGIYRDKTSWPDVNKYLQQPRIAGKAMYDMDVDELKALSRKLRLIAAKARKNAQTDNFLATNN